MTSKERILNALIAAASGDAIGAVTEHRSTDRIVERFGGYVTDFREPPEDNLAHGQPAGFVTDDFSIAYYSAQEYLRAGSHATEELTWDALIHWYRDGRYLRYVGPTTLGAIRRRMGLENDASGKFAVDTRTQTQTRRHPILCENQKVTNGAGMKAGIVALFNPGNVDGAIRDAFELCRPTHNHTISLAAGCTVAGAAAAALAEHTTYKEVLEAALYAAHVSFEQAKEFAKPVAGGNIEKRTRLAIEIGMRYQNDFDQAMREISALIGGGLYAYEAIPAVFGHVAACEGRTVDSVLMGVNGGDDTDTVACMTGYVVGGLDQEGFPLHNASVIKAVNGFDLETLAADIDAFNRREALK